MTRPNAHRSILYQLIKDRTIKKKFTRPMVFKSDKKLSDDEVDYFLKVGNGEIIHEQSLQS